jgi:two-component sensor histidine kinase
VTTHEPTMTALQIYRETLLEQARARLGEPTEWTASDLDRLLDLSDEPALSARLDAIEAEGQGLAEARARLDVRLESLEHCADALSAALDDLLTADATARDAAQTTLHRAHRTHVTAIARGFQRGIERLALVEHDRAVQEQRRLYAVQRINSVTNSTLDMEEMLTTTARTIADELPIDLCAIFLHDNITNELTLYATSSPTEDVAGHFVIHLGDQITGMVTQQSTPSGVMDIADWAIPPIETQLFGRDYRSIFVVPIICLGGDSSTLEGALTLLKKEPFLLSEEEKGFLELVSGLLALSIENSKVYHHAEEARRRQLTNIAMLQSISATVATSFDLQRVLQMIVSNAGQILLASHGAIFLMEPDGELRLAARHNLDDPSLRDTCVHIGECCVGRAVEQSERVWGIECMHTAPDCYLRHLSSQMHDVHTSQAVPLVSKGQVHGVLHLLRPVRHTEPGLPARMVDTFANEAAIAIESTRLYEETRTSLEIKSHLLQEMHHRVKNNLLSIAAILRMERRRTASPEAARVLSESISRIDGMAATHDLLSREEHIGTTQIGDIATKLVGVVSAYLIPPSLRVEFEVKAGSVEVHSKKALTLALVLNELLANAIEHGMAERAAGKVRIGAWEEEDHVRCIVADDGAGLPPDLDITQMTSLGLALVRDMTRDQLRGTFTLRRDPLPEPMRDAPTDATPWTLAELTFPPERDDTPGTHQ